MSTLIKKVKDEDDHFSWCDLPRSICPTCLRLDGETAHKPSIQCPCSLCDAIFKRVVQARWLNTGSDCS